MFISANQFERDMGINKTIGSFFVDRKLPENNSFWKGRFLYISFGNGFVFIPVYYDILHRLDVQTEVLLDEKHIRFMEQIMHLATLQEYHEISFREELQAVRSLLEGRVQNMHNFDALGKYLDQPVLNPMGAFGLSCPSLNRADVFLYVLCDLPLNSDQWDQAINYWYKLLPSYLIMDDIRDYVKDKEDGEENVVIDLGDGSEGFEKAFEMLDKNSEALQRINPLLSRFLKENEGDLRKFIPVNI